MPLRNIRNWFSGLFVNKKSEINSATRCCFRRNGKTLYTLIAEKKANQIILIHAAKHEFDTIDNLSYVISGMTKKYGLVNSAVHWLLSPDDYQLFLIESLPVQENELKDALQWRIRSLINFPFEEAVIDQFKFPPKKPGTESNMIAAVVSRQAQLNQINDTIKKSGLTLSVIDIPELALRNLSAQYEADEKTTAFIYFYEQAILLNITIKKTLYFTRKINNPFKQKESKDYEQIALELLRYFDYFQSQWRKPSPSRIFIGAEKEELKILTARISEYLMTNSEIYDVMSMFSNNIKQVSDEQKYLLNLGCLLRGAS